MPQYTSRVGLIKPDPQQMLKDSIKPINDNFDEIDQYLGAYLVENGAAVPNAVAYNGMLVREKDSNILYELRANGLGGYTKKYISYPLYFQAKHRGNLGSGPIPAAASFRQGIYGDGNFMYGTLNVSLANWNGGYFVIPFTGIYHFHMYSLWDPDAAGNRAMMAVFNGVAQSSQVNNGEYEVSTHHTDDRYTGLSLDFIRPFTAGTNIGLAVWQTGSKVNNFTAVMQATMTIPLGAGEFPT